MFYCKDLNKLSILSLYEGELLGQANKLFFDKNLKKLIEVEIVNQDGAKFSLPTKNIYHVGTHAITVKNNQALTFSHDMDNLVVCPLGSKAYSINGEFLGIVEEITLTNKFLTEKIALDNNTILESSNLASCGKNSLIFNNGNKKISLKKFTPETTPKSLKKEPVQIAKIMPAEPQNTKTVPLSVEPTNPNFLLGRICEKDIVNFNNEPLIKAHTKVTKKNLKEITKYGKIRELMLFIK